MSTYGSGNGVIKLRKNKNKIDKLKLKEINKYLQNNIGGEITDYENNDNILWGISIYYNPINDEDIELFLNMIPDVIEGRIELKDEYGNTWAYFYNNKEMKWNRYNGYIIYAKEDNCPIWNDETFMAITERVGYKISHESYIY